MISYIVYYHTERQANLEQTLRFLCKREDVSQSELILVCQNLDFKQYHFPFRYIRHINMSSDVYNKPKMVNLGVSKAANKYIAILDSDRVLPVGYFERATKVVEKKCCVSTVPLFKIRNDVSDADLEAGLFESYDDSRSVVNDFHKKNMFSGNTLMLREDYVKMDEEFEDYGYNDTDTTQHLASLGYKYIWLQEKELHLFHSLVRNRPFVEFLKSNVRNGMRYCIKWGLEPSGLLLKESREVGISYEDVLAEYRVKKLKLI